MSQAGTFSAGGGGGSDVETLTGNSGGAVSPTGGNINVIGSGDITVTGNPGTSTLTISSSGSSGISTLDGDTGSATGSTVTIAGGSNISTSASGATVTINLINSPSVSGSVTAGTGFVATTGDVTIDDGNLSLPDATSSSVGNINSGGSPFIRHVVTGNIFVGNGSGNTTLSGSYNNILGDLSCPLLTSGFGNIAIGAAVMNIATSASNNIMIGQASGIELVSGNSNVAIGYNGIEGALDHLVSGSNNIGIGYDVGISYTSSESNNILLSNVGSSGESNVMRLGTTGTGSGQVSTTFIAGVFGVTVGVSAIPVVIDNVGNVGTVVSSRKFKENIRHIADLSESIYDLLPRVFNFIKQPESQSFGLIAEEVAEVMPSLVVSDDNGDPFSIKYQDLPILLLNEIKKLKVDIDELKRKITRG
jgi:hypothetical protein